MKHTLYTLEKKQFHLEGYWLFAGVLFFCYVLSIQMNMQTIYLDLQNGRIPDSVTTVSLSGILSYLWIVCLSEPSAVSHF